MDKLFESLLGAIFGALFTAIIGLFAAFFVIKIVKVVREHITHFNIGRLTKKALEEDQRTRDMLSEVIQLAVEKKNGSTISISALKQGKKVAEVQLSGESVAPDIKVGDPVNLAAVAY